MYFVINWADKKALHKCKHNNNHQHLVNSDMESVKSLTGFCVQNKDMYSKTLHKNSYD